MPNKTRSNLKPIWASICYLVLAASSHAVAQEGTTSGEASHDISTDLIEIKIRKGTKVSHEEARTWLDDEMYSTPARASSNGLTFKAGFVPSDQITTELLKRINKKPMYPWFEISNVKMAKPWPTEVLTLPANKYWATECSALLQFIPIRGRRLDKTEIEKHLNEFRGWLPRHPLDDQCKPINAWSHLEFGTGHIVSDGKKKAIYDRNQYQIVDEAIGCDLYPEKRLGVPKLQKNTRVIVQGQVNHMPLFPSTRRLAGEIQRRFTFGLNKAWVNGGIESAQFFANDYLKDDPDVIKLEYSLIDDHASDQFCLIAKFEQGESVWIDSLKIDRDGREADWATQSPDRPDWDSRGISSNFGEKIGRELLEQQPVEQSESGTKVPK